MKKKTVFIITLGLALTTLYSCTKDRTKLAAPVNCSGISATTNTWSLNVNPNIISFYCAYAPCHGGGSAQLGVDLSTYASTVNAFETKNVICSVKNAGCILMPNTGGPLPDTLILQLECWQQNGYKL